jgi:hypothetical protein
MAENIIRTYFQSLTFFSSTLPRRSIRELARRWCAPTQLDDREAFSRVMDEIVSAELPRNAYIVSLLLWALVQRRNLERVNEAALLVVKIKRKIPR